MHIQDHFLVITSFTESSKGHLLNFYTREHLEYILTVSFILLMVLAHLMHALRPLQHQRFQLPYSGKLSRVKIFCEFRGFGAIHESFIHELRGVVYNMRGRYSIVVDQT